MSPATISKYLLYHYKRCYHYESRRMLQPQPQPQPPLLEPHPQPPLPDLNAPRAKSTQENLRLCSHISVTGVALVALVVVEPIIVMAVVKSWEQLELVNL
eukprot:gene1383-4557_t